MLLFLTGAFLSTSAVDYLKHFRFAMMSFEHMPINKYISLEWLVTEYIETDDQTDEGLKNIGVHDKAALVVCMPILVLTAIILIVHIFAAGLNDCYGKDKKKYPK